MKRISAWLLMGFAVHVTAAAQGSAGRPCPEDPFAFHPAQCWVGERIVFLKSPPWDRDVNAFGLAFEKTGGETATLTSIDSLPDGSWSVKVTLEDGSARTAPTWTLATGTVRVPDAMLLDEFEAAKAELLGDTLRVVAPSLALWANDSLGYHNPPLAPAHSRRTVLLRGSTVRVLDVLLGHSEAEPLILSLETNEGRRGYIQVNPSGSNAQVPTLTLAFQGTRQPLPFRAPSLSEISRLVFTTVDEVPAFPGGVEGYLRFMEQNVIYPESARAHGIEGTVYVQFTIDRAGKIRTPRVIRSVHPSLDAAALRLVESMPDWEPGKLKGHPVAVLYTMPTEYRLR